MQWLDRAQHARTARASRLKQAQVSAIDKKLRTRVRPALVQQQRKCKHSNMHAALSRQVVGGTGLFDGVAQRAAVQLCIVRRVAGPNVVAALCTWDWS